MPYSGCPICGQNRSAFYCEVDVRSHPLWHAPLPGQLRWLRCDQCGHIFTDSFYTEEGLKELFLRSNPGQVNSGDLDRQRILWSPVVERVVGVLPEPAVVFGADPMRWLDVGCGAGGLAFVADEFGFIATGLDLRAAAVRAIQELGYQAILGDLLALPREMTYHIISMADVLEHMPYPVGVLKRAWESLQTGGILFLSCPNRESSSWRQMDLLKSNIYWGEIEHYHNFSRRSLMWLLRRCGFLPLRYSVSNRYKACMEIIAVKNSPSQHPDATRGPDRNGHEHIPPIKR